MCRVLEITTSAYYQFAHRRTSAAQTKQVQIIGAIKIIRLEKHHDAYGSEREPADGRISTEERAAETLRTAHRAINQEWFDGEPSQEEIPEEVWNRNDAGWDGHRVAT